jgi:Domain of unknown function (DUF4062)
VRVFVSSTQKDLIEHRRAVGRVLEQMGQSVARMEGFGPRPGKPVEESLAEVDKCELFLGIYAHSYGTTPDGKEISITEREYERAVEEGKPVLAFIVDNTFDWDKQFREGEPGRSRLERLKERIRRDHIVAEFTTPDDLAATVAAGVANQIQAAHVPAPPPNAPVSLANVALLHTSWFSAKQTALKGDGRRYYVFDVVVIAPAAVMERITSVLWRMSDVWPERYAVQLSRNRADRFRMRELANGTSIVRAEINLDGQPEPLWLNRFIDLREEGPRL